MAMNFCMRRALAVIHALLRISKLSKYSNPMTTPSLLSDSAPPSRFRFQASSSSCMAPWWEPSRTCRMFKYILFQEYAKAPYEPFDIHALRANYSMILVNNTRTVSWELGGFITLLVPVERNECNEIPVFEYRFRLPRGRYALRVGFYRDVGDSEYWQFFTFVCGCEIHNVLLPGRREMFVTFDKTMEKEGEVKLRFTGDEIGPPPILSYILVDTYVGGPKRLKDSPTPLLLD